MLAISASIFFQLRPVTLRLRTLEPLARADQPVATREQEHDTDGHWSVVEVVAVDRAECNLGEHEQNRYQGDPDDADPPDERAPLAERPPTALPTLAF